MTKRKTNKITVENALMLIASSNGKIFTVTFKKKDGTTRKMNCRTGVKKGVNGRGLAFNPKDYGLVTVFDVKANEFRMVNTTTLKTITMEDETFKIVL